MEGTWRILGFNMTKKYPGVGSIPIHLPDNHAFQQYHRNTPTSTLSALDRYFVCPLGTFMWDDHVQEFADLTYCEYNTLFRFARFDPNQVGHESYFVEQPNHDNSPPQHVILRQRDRPHITRLHDVPPSQGETFYLRCLLQHRSASSFLDLRTVNGVVCDSFQEAATTLGLFANEREAEYTMTEAVDGLKTPRQLRLLFVHLLVNNCVAAPLEFWQRFKQALCLDFTLQSPAAPHIGVDRALDEIGWALEEHGKRLSDYALPQPRIHGSEVEHEYHCWGQNTEALATRANDAVNQFNHEQLEIYQEILSSVLNRHGLLAFVDGQAGTGKTFLVRTLCDKIRSLSLLALPTATAGYAAQLYHGGRTTHSAFKVRVFFKSFSHRFTLLTDPCERMQ